MSLRAHPALTLCLALTLADPEGRAEAWGSSHGPGGLKASSHRGLQAQRQPEGPSGWLWKDAITPVHGAGALTLGHALLRRTALFHVSAGEQELGVGHGKAGGLGSHRPGAESPAAIWLPLAGRQGALRGGPVAGWGQRRGAACVCGMTQDP